MSNAPFPPSQLSPQPAPQPGAGLGIAALVLGIAGFIVPLLGLIAIVLGIIALVRAVPDPTNRPGKGLAIGGIIAGSLGTAVVCGAFMLGMLLPALGKARQSARQVVSMSNLRQIGLGLQTYATNNNDWMPETAEAWIPRLSPYLSPSAFQSPYVQRGSVAAGYIYFPPGAPLSQLPRPDRFVIALESPDLEDIHRRGGNILFADGHIEYVTQPQHQQVIGAVKSGKNPPTGP